MSIDDAPNPMTFKGVMVSSTFTDLKEHRTALIRIINSADLKPVVMEHDAAKPDVDVVESSLGMVKKAAAYIGVISHKYGQTPDCPNRNPDQLSITELEFNEAQKLKRSILLFIMGDDHPVTKKDIESDPQKTEKLNAFRERAKKMGLDTQVHRVYATFNNLEEFKELAAKSISDLCQFLAKQDDDAGDARNRKNQRQAAKANRDAIPSPPAFYAEPPYIGSHEFVGRRDQLETLNEWALPADAHPVLLFEAIGGTGKSLLTWEWVRNDASAVRADWAGRFWYSFYERGAIMADFCRRALAYMTGQPLAELQKKKTAELAPLLLHQLQTRPWLLILDGLERVLVAYHRIDAAQLRDEEAGQTDVIAQRDPCAAIRPEDDELLRLLATAAPSKLLLTSRLIPRVLLNSASQPIPGVLRERLPGLRPADAEALFRACQVTGDSAAIQTYLKTHCDCHPLTVGALAGLVTHYLPARGDFDQWSAVPDGGGKFDFANLDLVQKRNHILRASIDTLPPGSRRLLSMIALLSEAVDYETLKALNPQLPPEIAKLPRPARWKSPEFLAAQARLVEAIEDLEKRGLLQYDVRAGHYDLHPVVRGVAAGGLASDERETLGQRVVDHFSERPHNPYEHAETLDDVRDGLHVVRTLVQMRRFRLALAAYRGDLSRALLFNLEAFAEIVALLRPFFPNGWGSLPTESCKDYASYLSNNAAIAFGALGHQTEEMAARGSHLSLNLAIKAWRNVSLSLFGVSTLLSRGNRLVREDLCVRLALDLASLINDSQVLFGARLDRFRQLARLGQWPEAEALWRRLDSMGRQWMRAVYRPGDAEYDYAQARFWKGDLQEKDLARAEHLARKGRNRQTIRDLHGLRGEWRLERGEWALAAESLHEAVAMAQAVGRNDPKAETKLALAKFHLGQLAEPRAAAERLAKASKPAHLDLATLWLAIGDRDQANKHALAAYKWAWADGEPFVHRYQLNKSRVLLEQLGAEIPNLPPYDPAQDEKLPWEDAVLAAIEELRAEKASKVGDGE